MGERWIDHIPKPEPGAVHIDAVVDDDFGIIVRASTDDGREATAAERW